MDCQVLCLRSFKFPNPLPQPSPSGGTMLHFPQLSGTPKPAAPWNLQAFLFFGQTLAWMLASQVSGSDRGHTATMPSEPRTRRPLEHHFHVWEAGWPPRDSPTKMGQVAMARCLTFLSVCYKPFAKAYMPFGSPANISLRIRTFKGSLLGHVRAGASQKWGTPLWVAPKAQSQKHLEAPMKHRSTSTSAPHPLRRFGAPSFGGTASRAWPWRG